MGAEKETEHFSRAAKADTSLHMQAFSREHFVGPEMFSKLSAVDTCTFDCGHKLGAEIEKYNVDFLLECTMALKHNYIFLSNSEGSFETAQCQLVALP